MGKYSLWDGQRCEPLRGGKWSKRGGEEGGGKEGQRGHGVLMPGVLV